MALLGYFGTMVTALVGLMLLLNTVLSSSYVQQVHQRPYPMPAIVEAAIPDKKATMTAEAVRAETLKPVVAEKKNARVKVARDQRRKEDFAGRRQDREYSLALGYAQESQRLPSGAFDPFATRRF